MPVPQVDSGLTILRGFLGMAVGVNLMEFLVRISVFFLCILSFSCDDDSGAFWHVKNVGVNES